MTADPDARRQLARALRLVALVEDSWPSARFNDGHREQYAKDIAHLDPEEAAAAVEVLKRSGREFAPPAGDVAREVARLQIGAPDWVDVKRSLIRRQEAMERARGEVVEWTCPHGECDGSGFTGFADPSARDAAPCRCRPARLASMRAADELHPLVQEFIEEGFVTWGEVDAVGQGGRDAATLEAQMRVKWETFARRAVESRAIAAIEGPPSLLRLEQARDEDGQRTGRGRGQLERPDYLAALPRG